MLDYMTEPEAYGKCERCFKRYGFPADWVLEPAEVPGLETDDSVDTQSETDVVALLSRPCDRGKGGQDRALASAQTGILRNGGCARLSFRNGAISLHTRSSVFESLRWVAHGAHPAVDI